MTIALFALFAAGCGGDDEEGEPIPAADADALLTQLELVRDRSDRGICGGANTQVDQLEQKAAALPEDVDPDVRSALDEGLEHLRDLVNDECEENREEPETDTTETEPPPVDTEPEETEPEETEPEETVPPPEETEPAPDETAPEVPPIPPDESGGAVPPGDSG